MKRAKEPNEWKALEDSAKAAALQCLRDYMDKGDVAPGAMAVKEMTLYLTQMGWKIAVWIDEELKKRERSA